MIFYGTKSLMSEMHKDGKELSEVGKMIERATIEKEQGNPLFEWAVNTYCFGELRCTQIVNVASRLTVFVCQHAKDDVRLFVVGFLKGLIELYGDDEEINDALLKYLKAANQLAYLPLKNRSMQAALNYVKVDIVQNGYGLEMFMINDQFNNRLLNEYVSHYMTPVTIDNVKQYVIPKEYFKTLIMDKYK